MIDLKGVIQEENVIQGELGLGVDYYKGEPGQPGKDGEPGKDGISVSHSWNGTELTITSASGTSSADLKGENYILTDTDKSEIAEMVLALIPDGEEVSY